MQPPAKAREGAEVYSSQSTPDHGPWYAETQLDRFPAEPANTLSNLVFLGVIVLAIRRLRTEGLRSLFFKVCVGILAVGWFGGTVYHATRSSFVWLALDFIPIFVLCLMATLWLVVHLQPRQRRLYLFGLLPGLCLVWGTVRFTLSQDYRIGFGYVFLASLILLPAALHCAAQEWRGRGWLLGGGLAFVAAVSFRFLDRCWIAEVPRLGTHFLWHLFGGVATFCILNYLLDAESAKSKTRN